MEITGIQTNYLTNLRAKNKNMMKEAAQSAETNTKDVLSNPLETVGRSQVQFKSRLDSESLNQMAEIVAKIDLKAGDISTLKQALSSAMEKRNLANFNEVRTKLGNDFEGLLQFVVETTDEAARINPKADLDKINTAISLIF